MIQQGDRRSDGRRNLDRRHSESAGGRRGGERRRFDRRKLAGAGLLAVVALGGARYHHDLGQGWGGEAGDATVEVMSDNFHIPTWDRASLEPLVQAAAAQYDLHPDLVRAVIQTESRWDPHAVSPVGAKGLMQLMPSTAKRVGIDNPFDPKQNIFGGAKYLSMMMERFKGNTALALAGYNAGPEKVKRHRGVPPYRETQGYVRKIQKLVADTDAAFNIPIPVVQKTRRASLRSSSRRAAITRASARRASASKARTSVSARRATAAREASVARRSTSAGGASVARRSTSASRTRVSVSSRTPKRPVRTRSGRGTRV